MMVLNATVKNASLVEHIETDEHYFSDDMLMWQDKIKKVTFDGELVPDAKGQYGSLEVEKIPEF